MSENQENKTLSIVDKVQETLGKFVQKDAETDEKVQEGYSSDKPEVVEVPNFVEALAKATPEQLQQFKQLLNNVPSTISTNPEYNEAHVLQNPDNGKYVVAFSNAFEVRKFDEVTQANKLVLAINVRLLDINTGETEDIREDYNKFMYDYKKVNVKLLKRFVEAQDAKDGITESVETGEMVQMIKKWENETYRVELPEGKKVTLPIRVINAGASATRADTQEGVAGDMSAKDIAFDIV